MFKSFIYTPLKCKKIICPVNTDVYLWKCMSLISFRSFELYILKDNSVALSRRIGSSCISVKTNITT